MQKIYSFNPDHEMALASGNKHFKPKKNIVALKNDLATLPIWLDNNYLIDKHAVTTEWLEQITDLSVSHTLSSTIDYTLLDKVDMWGWNNNEVYRLKQLGVSQKLMPDDYQLRQIRHLTERQTAIDAMKFISNKFCHIQIPKPAQRVESLKEIETMFDHYNEIVLKSPLSESGKGVYFTKKDISQSIKGWIKKELAQNGYIIAEKRYSVIQNFAMEFQTSTSDCLFIGYSLFNTNGKSYTGNILLDDKEIEHLITKMVDSQLLNQIRNTLIKFINKELTPYYEGYIGVDMFIFNDNDILRLHPCVEINLRATMGLMAHNFYKKFVADNKRGFFRVDFYKNSNELLTDHNERCKKLPLRIKNGRITGGYISLCPIMEGTKYRVRVEISD